MPDQHQQHRPARRPLAPLTESVVLRCADGGDDALTFRATFGYDAADPYAIRVTFPVPGGQVHWVLARNLLQRGLHEPAGLGDVLLRPGHDDGGRPVVVLEFRSPDGRLVVEARSGDLLAFLLQTWALVPLGSEVDHVDLDVLVDQLLAG